MSGYVWRHQLDRIIIALFVLGKTYVVEPIFLLNLYWQKKCTLTVLEWSHFCLHYLDRICPKSFIFQDSEMKKVEEIWILRFDMFFWVAFEFQFLPHLPCDIFRTNLETSGNMYFDFRKGLWVFIIALYYKSTHLQNSGRDHVQWHKPLGSTLIWLANIIVHCQSCQCRSQDSFVELKFYVYSRCYEYSNSFHPKY